MSINVLLGSAHLRSVAYGALRRVRVPAQHVPGAEAAAGRGVGAGGPVRPGPSDAGAAGAQGCEQDRGGARGLAHGAPAAGEAFHRKHLAPHLRSLLSLLLFLRHESAQAQCLALPAHMAAAPGLALLSCTATCQDPQETPAGKQHADQGLPGHRDARCSTWSASRRRRLPSWKASRWTRPTHVSRAGPGT